ncbi:MAG TPA: sigma-54-dependent Fis family transcriptional regulator [Deltaproteobacteria bacterium]|nr:sigma-54-dependent Fis family transcriptional regulator [Deltaproteobacteria bacterium]
MARILVVDDDRSVRKALQVNLSKQGMQVTLANHPDEALEALHEAPYDLVLTDVRMPGSTGLQLLQKVREAWPDTPVVMMTGYGSVEDAVTAMKSGAADYLIKPISKDELLVVIDRALEQRSLRAELVELRREVHQRYGFENLVGATPCMVQLYEEVAAVADTSATVLLIGETGTGKELLAHAIHYRSRRANGPFVRVNCAAIPETLLESELFGHEKGAFTGAIRQHKGKFEQADGGTLLLDEIGEINAFMQVKLLRVLENGEFQRIGSTQTTQVDVRVVASTNKDLAREVREKRFRSDLFYRLNVVTLSIPPLRDRVEDIPLLVDHFLVKYAARNDRTVHRIGRRAMEKLERYDWPGNVRQLEHLIERAVILTRDDVIDDLSLPDEDEETVVRRDEPLLPPGEVTLQEWLLAFERRVIVAALKEASGVQARAARRLGVSRSNLNYRIGRLGIAVKEIEYE